MPALPSRGCTICSLRRKAFPSRPRTLRQRARTIDVMRSLVWPGRRARRQDPRARVACAAHPGTRKRSRRTQASSRLFCRSGRSCGNAGVTYCIEPLARSETAVVNTVAEAVEIVAAVGSPALRTMIDCSAAARAETRAAPRPDPPLAADGACRAYPSQRSQPARSGRGRPEVRADPSGTDGSTLFR